MCFLSIFYKFWDDYRLIEFHLYLTVRSNASDTCFNRFGRNKNSFFFLSLFLLHLKPFSCLFCHLFSYSNAFCNLGFHNIWVNLCRPFSNSWSLSFNFWLSFFLYQGRFTSCFFWFFGYHFHFLLYFFRYIFITF